MTSTGLVGGGGPLPTKGRAHVAEAWAAGPAPPPPPAAGRRLAGLVAGGLLLVAWFVWLRPPALGGSTSLAIVEGTSMEPTLVDGDLAIVRRQHAYQLGQIVAFRVPDGEPGAGATIIHRIVGHDGSGFAVQGDNKSGPDPWMPRAPDVIGRMWLRLPGAGRLVALLRTPLGTATIAAALTFVTIFGWRRKTPIRHLGRGSPLVGWLVATSLVAGAVAVSAAMLTVEPGTLARFVLPPPSPPTIGAAVDIQPSSLQKRSQGVPVSATVEFALGVDLADVDTSSIRLCLGTAHCGTGGVAPTSVRIGDANGNGMPDLRLRFPRAQVIALVQSVPTPATVDFTVSGVVGTVPFAGTDDVRLVDPDEATDSGSATSPAGSTSPAPSTPASPAPGPTSSLSPSPSPGQDPPPPSTTPMPGSTPSPSEPSPSGISPTI